MKTPTPTGVDKTLGLDAIYYSAPMPRDLASLTILGAVFDKVYFPGVYLPKDGYDQAALNKEIERIQNLGSRLADTQELLAMLSFLKQAKVLDGFCVFEGDGSQAFQAATGVSHEALKELYFAIHGPPANPGWEPMFNTSHRKSLPGGDEHVSYLDTYPYMMNAVVESGKRGIPLINDRPAIPVLGPVDNSTPQDDAKALSTILAIECAKIALPDMPVLRPEELMEFRAENVVALRGFRRSMLNYAAELNDKIKDLSPDEFGRKTQFFVETEIVPVLDSLRAALDAPARPWYRRVMDGAKVTAQVGLGFVTMEPNSAMANALVKYAGLFADELTAEGDHRTALKRSGLFYLLNLERFQRKHSGS